ncbi:MAG: FliM/FliN family flagellar motor switch protein, partial [Planctomycetota bacterium]|nr:FliM/FliN family flagellar motor switch protein [Planctomycetota bacterium]
LWMIQRLLGAPAEAKPPERELTRLEATLAESVLQRLLESLDECWRRDTPLRLEVLEYVRRPSVEHAAADDTPLATLRWSVDVESIHGELQVGLPQGPLLTYLSGPEWRPSLDGEPENGEAPGGQSDVSERILERLDGVTVDFTADLTTRPLPLDSLAGLQPGDIVDTGIAVERPVDLRIGGRRIAEGTAGDLDGRLSVRVRESNERESGPDLDS